LNVIKLDRVTVIDDEVEMFTLFTFEKLNILNKIIKKFERILRLRI